MISSARLLRNFLRKPHPPEAPALTLAAEVGRHASLVPLQEARVANAIQCTIESMQFDEQEVVRLASHMYGWVNKRQGREGSPVEWWLNDSSEQRQDAMDFAAEVMKWINETRFQSTRQEKAND